MTGESGPKPKKSVFAARNISLTASVFDDAGAGFIKTKG